MSVDLRDELQREAARVTPGGSLPDVMVRVRRRRLRRRVAFAAGLGALLVVAGLAGIVARRRDRNVNPAVSPLAQISAIVTPGAPVGAGAVAAPSGGYSRTLDSYDATAEQGAWTVVVRAANGSLGLHSAVVSYPVPKPVLARQVRIGDVVGGMTEREVAWPIAGGYAKVHGDLPDSQLVAIAAATRIVDHRPVVGSVVGLTVGPSRPYRAVHVDEVRMYDLATADTVLGFVYTDVEVSGGFEDQLFAGTPSTGFTVHGHPAVISTVNGGNATIAWEPAPGVVADVGYSGRQLDDLAIAALVDLANRSTTLDALAWAATQPQVIAGHNGPSDM